MFRFILLCAFLAAVVWWPGWLPSLIWETVPHAAGHVAETAADTYRATKIPVPLFIIVALAVVGVLLVARRAR